MSCSDIARRVGDIRDQLGKLVEGERVGQVAMESWVYFGNSSDRRISFKAGYAVVRVIQTIYDLGEWIGFEVHEYPTQDVKRAVCGRANVTKKDVKEMLPLHVEGGVKGNQHVIDAMAVAVCCAQRLRIKAMEARRV